MTDESKGRDKGKFKKGVSGNPKGRPKKVSAPPTTDLLSLLQQNLDEKVEVVVGGKTKIISMREYLIRDFIKESARMKGIDKLRYMTTLVRYSKEFVVPLPPDTFDWSEEQEKLFQELEEWERNKAKG